MKPLSIISALHGICVFVGVQALAARFRCVAANEDRLRARHQRALRNAIVAFSLSCSGLALAEEDSRWQYSPESMRPFWSSETIDDEPILFVRDEETGESRGSLLFPIRKILSVQSSAGDVTYQEGTDYRFRRGSRELVIPAGSRIVTTAPSGLRRPANSQKYRLTHRDGQGEILFGANLEYHQMQTHVTYQKDATDWPVPVPSCRGDKLPGAQRKLRNHEPLSVVLLGDSISTGCNASGWGNGPPYQPAYHDLLAEQLRRHYQTDVTLKNLSVGGKSTSWGVTMIDAVASDTPDLVIVAFGMNDSSGRSPEEYGRNTAKIISGVRDLSPNSEFILVASMLGNRDWTTLNHDVFPRYRDVLAKLQSPSVALADMTSVWDEFLKHKKDADLTGNGVNHPNDFGHRVYAQVITSLLIEHTAQ